LSWSQFGKIAMLIGSPLYKYVQWLMQCRKNILNCFIVSDQLKTDESIIGDLSTYSHGHRALPDLNCLNNMACNFRGAPGASGHWGKLNCNSSWVKLARKTVIKIFCHTIWMTDSC
jgi:hypothetical protein